MLNIIFFVWMRTGSNPPEINRFRINTSEMLIILKAKPNKNHNIDKKKNLDQINYKPTGSLVLTCLHFYFA